MIRCQKCGKTSKPGEPTHLIVTERRERVYDNRKHNELGEIVPLMEFMKNVTT